MHKSNEDLEDGETLMRRKIFDSWKIICTLTTTYLMETELWENKIN